MRGSGDISRYDENGQIVSTATQWFGNHITTPGGFGGSGDWGTAIAERDDLWGNGLGHLMSRANHPTSLYGDGIDASSGWSDRGRANNPCPPGWRIPSAAEWGDMHSGNGTGVGAGTPIMSGPSHNIWTWRDIQTGTTAFGGTVFTNPVTNESVFLPAAGIRNNTNGMSSNGGERNSLWSSTFQNAGGARNTTQLSTGLVRAGSASNIRQYGMSVRCVQ